MFGQAKQIDPVGAVFSLDVRHVSFVQIKAFLFTFHFTLVRARECMVSSPTFHFDYALNPTRHRAYAKPKPPSFR